MKKYRIWGIEWDIDEEERPKHLPYEVVFEVADSCTDVGEYLENLLSDVFGYCHYGFQYAEATPSDTAQLTQIHDIIEDPDRCAEDMVAEIGEILGCPL